MSASLAGRVAIVTGGSKGIGKGIARVLAKAGAIVAIAARDVEHASAAALDIGLGSYGIAADVTSEDSMNAMAKAVAERSGQIDILCANAGIFPSARLEDMTGEQWDLVMDTNLKGTFLTVKACVPYLKISGQGRIVLTSSITGPITGYPGWTHYGASKAGQLGFMRTACLELAKYGITVNAVLPGNIMTEGMIENGEAYIAGMAAAIPLKKLGTVDDIGHAALYFASAEASYVTGQTIVVDGGQIQPESQEALNAM